MEELKQHLIDYIEWLKDKPDVFYAFDDPQKAASEFINSEIQ